MRLVMYGHNVEVTDDIRTHVEQAALQALSTLRRTIGRVTVRLHRLPEGDGTVTTCHVFVELHPWGGLGVGEAAPTVEQAVDRAFTRAADTARHDIAKRRSFWQARRPMPRPDFSLLPFPMRPATDS